MRCRACNKNLNRLESIKKDIKTNEFLDMCFKCLGIDKKFKKEEFNSNDLIDYYQEEFNSNGLIDDYQEDEFNG